MIAEEFPHGLPHVGARYTGGFDRRGRLRYERTAEACPLCDSARATEVHHIDPVGAGGYQTPLVKRTPLGTWPLYTALSAACPVCHRAIHERRLGLVWLWDDAECKAQWDSGELLRAFGPHSPELLGLGRWETSDGRRPRC